MKRVIENDEHHPLDGVQVLIVDDDEPLRGSIVRGLRRAGAIVGEASGYHEAVALLSSRRFVPDAALVDLRLGDGWGLELVEALADPAVCCAFSVMTALGGHTEACLIGAGAVDLLRKPAPLAALIPVVQATAARSRFVREYRGAPPTPAPASEPADREARSRRALHNTIAAARVQYTLSEREQEVTRLICREFSDDEIAASLSVSVSTVKRIEKSLHCKTGARTRAGIVRACYELLEPA